VRLEEDEPEIFEIYIHWLEHGTLHIPPAKEEKPNREQSDQEKAKSKEAKMHHIRIAKAYILGEKLQAGDFMDAAIDLMISLSKSKPPHPHSRRLLPLPHHRLPHLLPPHAFKQSEGVSGRQAGRLRGTRRG
jgi:hypothetical protein